jgi:hypothetical protein
MQNNNPFPTQRKSTPISALKKQNNVIQEEVVVNSMNEDVDGNILNDLENEQTSFYEEYEDEPTYIPQEIKNDVIVNNICNLDDLQLLFIVIVVVLLIQVIPTGKLLEKIVSFDRIPYGDSFVKSILAGLLVFIIVKLLRL